MYSNTFRLCCHKGVVYDITDCEKGRATVRQEMGEAVRWTVAVRFYLAHLLSMFLFMGAFDHALGQALNTLTDQEVVLFDDGFESLRPGPLMPVVGPHTEYHFLPEAIPQGRWAVTAFDSGSETQIAWRAIRSEDGSASLVQTAKTKAKHWRPMVVAGERFWENYTIHAKLRISERTSGRVGIAVRQHNDRCYYFVGFSNEKAVIIRVQHEIDFQVPGEEILASAPWSLSAGEPISIQATCVDDHLVVQMGGLRLEAIDSTFRNGSIGLIADSPAQFDDVKVMCSKSQLERLQRLRADLLREENRIASTLPRPTLWRKILTPQYGTDRNLRFGDLNGDGVLDILVGQIVHHGPTDANSEIGCMTAIDLQGNVLWRLGIPDRWGHHLTNDVAFQIHDIDGNGSNEVVYCKNHALIIAEGATGKTIRSVVTPENKTTRTPFNRFPRVLGDSLLVANFRGMKHRGDLLLKDRYQQAWAFDSELNLLWSIECNTGHYPFAIDSDGDGREELSIGYSRWSPDGKVLWNHDQTFKDHADSVAVVDLDGDGKLETLWACSDEGFVLLDASGVPRQHLRLGHVQNLTVANIRADLPGLEIVSANFWKNQGLIHYYDSRGNVFHDFEPRPEHGSSIVPVNWNGDGTELILVGPDPMHGGLWDGQGRKVVRMPADGHPTKAYDALDLTGDSRDEIIVWDAQEIWIYTQDRESSTLCKPPFRNSLSNESNYRARISVPADSRQAKQ